MDNYSNADYVEMLILYGECQRNARLTCRVYRERFPDRQRFPTHGLITRLVNRARESGYVGLNRIERAGRPRDVRTVQLEERVIDAVHAEPGTSTRRLERRLHVSRTMINKITRTEKLHPYHKQRVQDLEGGDRELRLHFCQMMIRKDEDDPDFLRNMLWTDESLFTREGCFNQHNVHHYSEENPRLTVARNFQNKWKINM